jgi:Transcriptional regulator, AbiEi antitoxin
MRHKEREHSQAGRHDGLAELAARQHGVVSIRQLTGLLGYSRNAVSRAVGDGRLHRLHRGVYAVGHARISTQGESLAAVLASGGGALLSHYSAGWLWGIANVDPAPFHVTTAASRKPRSPIRLHEARLLTVDDRALREGIPVTALPRTLLDLAASVRFDWLERMVERSEELGLFDLRAVESLLARTVGHHGHARLRRAIALYKPSSFTRSGLEKRVPRTGNRCRPAAAADELRRARV